MTTMNFVKESNNEMKGGILCFEDGTFEAFTMTQAKKYKTMKGAVGFLTRAGYVEAPAEEEEVAEVMGFLIQEKVTEATIQEHEERYAEVMEAMAGKPELEQAKEIFESLLSKLKLRVGNWHGNFGKHTYKDGVKLLKDLRESTPTSEYRLLKCMIKYDKKTGFIVLGQKPEKFEVLGD